MINLVKQQKALNLSKKMLNINGKISYDALYVDSIKLKRSELEIKKVLNC